MSKVTTCLWFGKDAEAAVRHYVSIVPDSTINHIQRAVAAWPGGEVGDVIVVTFRLGGQSFMALNGGSQQIMASPLPSPSNALIKQRWTGSGLRSPPATDRRSCVAGCATGGASPGKSCRKCSHGFWPALTRRSPRASSRP